MSVYDPITYWTKRGETYKEETQARRHGRTERMFLAQEERFPKVVATLAPKSVLEVGCGFGRMTKLIQRLPSVIEYDAIDVSPVEIYEASQEIPHVKFSVSDFMSYRPTRTYDLVFACEVLMHIPPEQITGFIAKMGTHSNRYVANLDYYEPAAVTLKKLTMTKLHQGNFNHPYHQIYNQVGAKNVEEISLETKRWYGIERHPQSIFVAEK